MENSVGVAEGKHANLIAVTCLLVAIVVGGAGVFFFFEAGEANKKLNELTASMKMTNNRTIPVVQVEEVSSGVLEIPQEFIGRVEEIEAVDLKSRIEGFVKKVHVKDGDFVKKGDVLITIDDEAYVAQQEVKTSILEQVKTEFMQAERFYNRMKASDNGSVSQSDLDKAESDFLTKKVNVNAAIADLNLAKLNVEYCKIYAPISGKLGKVNYTEGNFVNQGSGSLVRLVQVSPVRVVFSLTDKDFLKNLSIDGKKLFEKSNVEMLLADGSEYGKEGKLSFINNAIDQSSGTIAVRVDFENSNNRLVAGGFVKLKVVNNNEKKLPLISQQSLMYDKDGASVFVVNSDQVVEIKRVKVGKAINGRCEIISGLTDKEHVITEGLQKVRPGQKAIMQMANSVIGGAK